MLCSPPAPSLHVQLWCGVETSEQSAACHWPMVRGGNSKRMLPSRGILHMCFVLASS